MGISELENYFSEEETGMSFISSSIQDFFPPSTSLVFMLLHEVPLHYHNKFVSSEHSIDNISSGDDMTE